MLESCCIFFYGVFVVKVSVLTWQNDLFLFLFSFAELGLDSGHQIIVADPTTPNTLTFALHLTAKMEN